MWRMDKKTYSWSYVVETQNYSVSFTGGSIIVSDRKTKQLIKRIKGFTYLYTGAIKSDETQFFALENGKHFYVYSLPGTELIKRITLPRGFASIDVAGFYSDDGKNIIIPASRYVYDGGTQTYQSSMMYFPTEVKTGYYEYVLCKYSSETLELAEKEAVADYSEFRKYRSKYEDE